MDIHAAILRCEIVSERPGFDRRLLDNRIFEKRNSIHKNVDNSNTLDYEEQEKFPVQSNWLKIDDIQNRKFWYKTCYFCYKMFVASAKRSNVNKKQKEFRAFTHNHTRNLSPNKNFWTRIIRIFGHHLFKSPQSWIDPY